MSAGVVLGLRLAGHCSMPAARARLRWWRLFGPSLAAVVGLLLSVAGVSAQAGPLAVVRRLIDVNNSNDLDAFFGLMTDDVIVIGIGECGGGVCAGKAAFRQELESGLEEVGAPPRLRMLGTPQVAGNTVTLRAEVRFVPNLPFFEEQGVERTIETDTFVVRGDKIALVFSTPDLSDAQTAAFLRFITAESPEPLPSEQEAVVRAILAALNLGNLEAVGALLADNVVRRIEPAPASETVSGKAALMEQARQGVAAHIRFEPRDFRVAGERVTFTHRWTSDSLRAQGIDFLVATSEVVVRGGKIVSITDTLTPESLAKLRAAGAPAPAPRPALPPVQVPRQLPRTGDLPLTAALALAGMVLAGLGLGLRRSPA